MVVMSSGMTENRPSGGAQFNPLSRNHHFQRNIPKAQEIIYNYLLEIVRDWSPDDVLEEFKRLFIQHNNTVSSTTLPSLYEIVFANQEQEFRNTLKRSCYILINNWDIARTHEPIQKLIQLFDDPILKRSTVSPTLQRLRKWLQAFVNSKDFEELKLFIAKYEDRDPIHWRERYTSYLLVPQYIDLNNPLEQRQAARALSRQLKERFKFDLAMYTARSQSAMSREQLPKNPTALGDEVLRLIKSIVVKRGQFSYANLANIFISQTQNLTYKDFKKSLQKYLIFSVGDQGFSKTLKKQLSEKLDALYVNHHDKLIDDALLLRTCNRVIEYLTTENHQEPSPLFVTLLSQGSPLTLVVVLLKIILICRNARTHLEARIANLIEHYKDMPESECHWVVNFFEIFRITMSIYAENIEFSLVSMQSTCPDSQFPNAQAVVVTGKGLDTYRIFSQHKTINMIDVDSEFLEQSMMSSGEILTEDETSPTEEPHEDVWK
jgi:hypothetical protein